MRIYGIFRGFPGLGRVVSGMALLNELRETYHADIKVYTYLQGRTLLDSFGISRSLEVDPTAGEITSLGLDPVGKVSVALIEDVLAWQPNLVMVDGEPLLIQLLGACYDPTKILALVNPGDIHNPTLPFSTRTFFDRAFFSAGVAIVHGINHGTVEDYREGACRVYHTNTIVRQELLELERSEDCPVISCVLGGGSQCADKAFVEATVRIGVTVASIVAAMGEYTFNIYCNDQTIRDGICGEPLPDNVNVFDNFSSPTQIYRDSALVICRAGRNTIGEILYLNIPGVLIAAGNNYRTREQLANIQKTTRAFFEGILCWDGEDADGLRQMIEQLLNRPRPDYGYVPGNKKAMAVVLGMLGVARALP